MPNEPAETADQIDAESPTTAPKKPMPSMVEQTITEGMDPTDLEERAVQLKESAGEQ